MISKAIITPQAEIDLIDIWQFIADDSIERADSFLDSIDNTVKNLVRMPNMGRSREEIARNLRSFPVGNYVVFYRIIEEGIEVLRVLHGSRDIKRFFEEIEMN
jgi:toxin ParE1/3/4